MNLKFLQDLDGCYLVFILHIDLPDEDSQAYKQYLEEKEAYESFEDQCWNNESDEDYPYTKGFWVEAIDLQDNRKAKMIIEFIIYLKQKRDVVNE